MKIVTNCDYHELKTSNGFALKLCSFRKVPLYQEVDAPGVESPVGEEVDVRGRMRVASPGSHKRRGTFLGRLAAITRFSLVPRIMMGLDKMPLRRLLANFSIVSSNGPYIWSIHRCGMKLEAGHGHAPCLPRDYGSHALHSRSSP